MTLNEKLNKIYEAIEFIEKRGTNKAQNYKFMRSVDVTLALRKKFIEHKIYAEINFEFVGAPYTIAREKAPNAPFTAVNARCSVVFWDLESGETRTASGLGSGCDNNDKAAYKAQTGALKYALKNAFLIPDEADPEADESVDRDSAPVLESPGAFDTTDDMPDFREASHAAPAPRRSGNEQATPAFVEAVTPRPAAAPKAEIPAAPAPAPVLETTDQPLPTAEREPGDDTEPVNTDPTMPTEEEMAKYRTLFSQLGDALSLDGKLKSSPKLPINRKLHVFLLHITKAEAAPKITKAQWDDFFKRVDVVKQQADGLVGLAKLVNKVNGIEEKPKK